MKKKVSIKFCENVSTKFAFIELYEGNELSTYTVQRGYFKQAFLHTLKTYQSFGRPIIFLQFYTSCRSTKASSEGSSVIRRYQLVNSI